MNPPITNEKLNFSSNYGLRVYSSGCYFLNENNQWNDRGLRVGNKTNHDQTHCLNWTFEVFQNHKIDLILRQNKNFAVLFFHDISDNHLSSIYFILI